MSSHALAASPSSAAAPSGAPATRGFRELDERVASGLPGIVLVRAPEGAVAALVEHIARAAEQRGLAACVALPGLGAPAFHLAASALRLAKANDARALAESIGATASRRRAVVVSTMPDEGSWDRAVLSQLADGARAALVVLVSEREESLFGADTFVVAECLDDDERHTYLAAAVEHEARKSEVRSVRDLSVFASRLAAPPDFSNPSAAASVLLACLALAARPWPICAAACFVDDGASATNELLEGGWIVERDASVRVVALPAVLPKVDPARVAEALVATFAGDPWAEARAAELYLGTDAERADTMHATALERLADPLARRELRRRWLHLACKNPVLVVRAAHRSLERGEHEEVLRSLETSGLSQHGPEHALLVGRALVGMGDFVGGKVAFERARSADAAGEHGAAIAVELAEAAYAQGALDSSREEATKVASMAPSPALLLRASNVLGKLKLAGGKWDDADAHFANDAMSARAEGLPLEELRARLNRAIAILSKGFVEEASVMLRAVLADSESRGYDQGSAYALTNLAATAWDRRDYATSLECLERAFDYHQALGSASMVAQTISSLADVRLRLGLVEQAAQTIGFARRAGLSPFRAAKFAFVATRVALARGDLARARREMGQSIAEATASNDVESLAEAHHLAARVALEEGDVAECNRHLAAAESHVRTDRARAETSLLAALAARAAGSQNVELARAALQAGRLSGDDAVVGEALTLLCQLHLDLGDTASARVFCEQATSVRDGVAEGLPTHVRAAYLARPESVLLGRLRTSLAAASSTEVVEAPRTERAPRVHHVVAPNREIVGEDAQIRALVATIKKVGPADATVLVKGESGTGKELVADALHRASHRASGPLVSVNCAALVETLLLSELFGHEKGAFTGAATRRLGRFEMADGGTLFLDEIGDISARTQVALLRVLQEKTFERVGGTAVVRVDVRVVCATHRDLRAMVERGEFREDLYYRIRGIQLDVPALRARTGDIPLLAESILARIAIERNEDKKRLSADAIELLVGHKWPGNVRELENALGAASLFTEGDTVGADELLENVEGLRAARVVAAPASAPTSSPGSNRGAAFGAHGAEVPLSRPSQSAPVSESLEEELDGALPLSEARATSFVYEQIRRGEVTLSSMKRQIERDCIARALVETKGNITKAAVLLGMKRPRLSQLVKQYGLTAMEGV